VSDDPTPCGLCGRPFDRQGLTRHHCLPRQKGGTSDDVELICSQCHGMVHATYTNRTLATLYPTIKQLRQAPELGPYLKWVRKQPPSRRTRNASRRRKL
jgi:5-methylcytosine-specific restriction enzyme A